MSSVYGGSRFCLVMCLSCNLSLNVMLASLHIYHLACQSLSVEHTELKFVATAAVALAWKQWEDREGVQNPHQKLAQLVKAYYLILCHHADWASVDNPLSDSTLQELANDWIVRDEGAEFESLREKLKLYEILILRAVQFHLDFPETTFNHILKTIRNLAPDIDADLYDAVYTCAVGLFCDYLRWPNYLNWDLQDVCKAIAFKAAVTMNLKFCARVEDLSERQLAIFASDDVPAILEDLRATYESAELAEAKTLSNKCAVAHG